MLSKIISGSVKKVPAVSLTAQESVRLYESSSLGHFLDKAALLVNSLSLDAPFVAVTWLWCLSAIYSCPIQFHHYYILFSITWLAYAGDRLLDILRVTANKRQTPRHQFTAKHFQPLLYSWCLIALISICYLPLSLSSKEMQWGFGLLGLLFLYFLACYYVPHLARRILAREFLVGIFFSTATHFFILIQLRSGSLYFAWTSFSFFLICTLNCLSISRWEFIPDQQAGEVTFFTSNPYRLHQFHTMLFAFFGLQLVISTYFISQGLNPAFELSLLLSTLLLWALDRSSLHPQLKPVLADMALLTPWLALGIIS